MVTKAEMKILNRWIDQSAKLETQIEKLRVHNAVLRDKIKSRMLMEGFSKVETTKSSKAVVSTQWQYTWCVDALRALLGTVRFKKLCPPKPDGPALRALLDTTEGVFKVKLAACAEPHSQINLIISSCNSSCR